MNLGDMITKAEIRATMCPNHGEFCTGYGALAFCRARVEKAINTKHNQRVRANRCDRCADGTYHVHLGA